MTKIIDGENAVMGRLAAYAAKEALKGEDIVVVNCDRIIITGSKKNIKENFEGKKKRIGSTQKGPKHSKLTEKIVKRAIRGMLPNARRSGRGKVALEKIKCYKDVPEKFKDAEKIKFKDEKIKFLVMKDIPR
ncbi:MAG: 50S ribosomal protein L13 [archaeon]